MGSVTPRDTDLMVTVTGEELDGGRSVTGLPWMVTAAGMTGVTWGGLRDPWGC